MSACMDMNTGDSSPKTWPSVLVLPSQCFSNLKSTQRVKAKESAKANLTGRESRIHPGWNTLPPRGN